MFDELAEPEKRRDVRDARRLLHVVRHDDNRVLALQLIHELKSRYTIVIVTHNMQQAARVSDLTAYFYLGRLIEFGPTEQLFTNPTRRETEDYITGRFG